MENKYTDEENIQILISLLKAHNIKKVIASPGTTNISFVASIQDDSFFEIYSCVDERSACYMACGLAEESGEPVVLTCTGATASRNYIPGLTEAFYRKLPIIAVTATQHVGKIGQLVPQVLDRSEQLNDIVKMSVQIPSVYSEEDKWACNLLINNVLLEAIHNGSGPVHINLTTTYSNNFSVHKLPEQRVIRRIEYAQECPKIDSDKVGIFVGAHSKWSDELTNAVDEFCEKYNGVVFCDHTSNYQGKYKIIGNVICDQDNYMTSLKDIGLLIHIGNVSGSYLNVKPRNVWRVNPDGMVRDTFKKLTNVFEMEEIDFFLKYNTFIKSNKKDTSYYELWKKEKKDFDAMVDSLELPFSNLWVAKNTIGLLPNKSIVHLGILNSLRSWNYFDNDKIIYGYSNTGGFGIDGIMSTIVGASLANKNKIIYGVLGDLAFFYDMNSLGVREISSNIRIIIINNGCGVEFHNYNNRGAKLGEEVVSKYIAADGHNGFKSKSLIKNYSESLGFKYYSADNKSDFLSNIDEFINSKCDQPMIYEIFTDAGLESDALKMVKNLKSDTKGKVKKTVKKVFGDKGIEIVKNIISK